MEYVEIIKIVRQTALDRGCFINIRDSKSTNSHYFELKSGKASMLFRISDHVGKTDVKTLRLDKPNDRKSVQGFINNCIEGLNRRSFRQFMTGKRSSGMSHAQFQELMRR